MALFVALVNVFLLKNTFSNNFIKCRLHTTWNLSDLANFFTLMEDSVGETSLLEDTHPIPYFHPHQKFSMIFSWRSFEDLCEYV